MSSFLYMHSNRNLSAFSHSLGRLLSDCFGDAGADPLPPHAIPNAVIEDYENGRSSGKVASHLLAQFR
jgi:hypothetical protein